MGKSTVIVLGPLSGGKGGIATIMQELLGGIEFAYSIDTGKSQSMLRNVFQPVWILFCLVKGLVIMRPSAILCFTSSGKSFFEKLLWCALAQVAGCRPVLVFVDGNFPRFYSSLNYPMKRLVWLMMRNVKIGVQSKGWEDYYSSIFKQNKIDVVKPLVNQAFFSPHEGNQYLAKSPTVKLLFVGWVMPAKGIGELLDAFSILYDEGADISLDIVGPIKGTAKWWSNILSNKIGTLPINVIGEVNDLKQLHSRFVGSDIFVLPSHAEGLPQVIVEAMAVGLPIVSTKVGAIEEVLEFDSLGLTVEPRDAGQLVGALRYLVSNKSVRENFSRQCRIKAESEFTTDACLTSYVQLLELG